jgi:hypothetical protein
MDVKTTCLNHDLHETVYMAQQLGFYECRKKWFVSFVRLLGLGINV